MSSIKIYPPNVLPQENITDVQFEIWKETIEVYLEIEEKFRKFLPGGRYSEWTPAENNEKRILSAIAPDKAEDLPDLRRDLRQFVSIVAKFVHCDYFNPIMRHSSSLKWIYKKIREDYNIQTQGIFFLNLLDLQWDPAGSVTPVGFYNQYRSLIIGNLAKKDSKIEWKNEILTEDERLSPSHEDLILLNVLTLIHPKLPSYIREMYAHKIGKDKHLMDFKNEILTKSKHFILEIESDSPQVSSIEEAQCNYTSTKNYSRPSFNRSNFQQRRYQQSRPRFTPNQQSASNSQPQTFSQQPTPFCRVCQLSGLSKALFTSHYLGEATCPSLSAKDKQLLTNRISQQLSTINIEEDDDSIAREYGYDQDETQQLQDQQQVKFNSSMANNSKVDNSENNSNFSKPLTCNFIQPVASQTLSVQDINKKDIFLDLDSGATVSYAKLSDVLAHGFKIKPNSQLSKLADGRTKMAAIGEIDEILYRNNWCVRFHAIVTESLHCPFVAGNNFIKENSIIQDFNAKTISVHKKYVISETSKSLILPTQPNNLLLQNNHLNVILPGQEVQFSVPHDDDTILAVQPWHQNKGIQWPDPQLCSVKNGQISVKNNYNEIVHTKSSPKVQVRTLNDDFNNNDDIPVNTNKHTTPTDVDNTGKIEVNKEDIHPDILRYVNDIHHTYRDVFNNDISTGYNHRYGKHISKLNWAGPNRPTAAKVQNINYDHQTKVLLQNVCDDLTEKGVFGIPQDYDIPIQYCSPAFLVRKQKAKNKAKQDLGIDDVRVVINFTQLNDYLKNIPTTITKPKDIFTTFRKWNYIITTDLHSGFFQNHVCSDDYQWLGVSTPFGGLRFLKRSGQGLIGQSEELDEMLSKILGPEMKAGKCARIADDIIVGGRTPMETAENYKEILKKFQAANIKISPSKTKVFLRSVDVLGWKWQQGGFLAPSPHRVNALRNTKHEDIKTVKDLRSWLGLYKTLLPSSPNLTLMLNPFDLEVADKNSKDVIEWDRNLINQFRLATEAVDKLQTLYLPHPDDQLLLEVDAAKSTPGIGHTLYCIKDGKKLPVAFHSAKLSPNHSKWMACELESLAFATAINSEYNILKECTKPIIITPDSKPVADAVKLIKKGHYSSNPRMQSFISNINRLPIVVQLASGKSNQNQSSDFQSRHPSSCNAEHCSICLFISEKSDSVIIPAAINHMEPVSVLHNRTAWNNIQDQQKACKDAKYLLKSGKTPTKQSGKIYSEIRRLCSVAKLDKDNMLIVPSQHNKFSTSTKDLIVIPQSHLPAVLWQIHNHLQHPTKSQLKAHFDKSFYSVGLTPALEKLYNECFFCSTQKKIPTVTSHKTETDVRVPGVEFHGDVIRRQGQCIFIVRDHFSSLTAAKIIKNETHQELKSAIIETINPIKLLGKCRLTVDNAKGFCPLIDNRDPDLKKLQIEVIQTDVFNKNANAVVDKGCQELEQELKRIEPDGRPVNNTTLQITVSRLNNKLRRQGQISSFEIHFNRDMNTGENLNLDYEKIRKDQIQIRDKHNTKHNEKVPEPQHKPQPGDIVVIKNKSDKHKARDVYIVSQSEEEKVRIQKIIHPHSNNPNIRSKQYLTNSERVFVTNSFHHIPQEKPVTTKKINNWNPIRNVEENSEDENENCKSVNGNKNQEYQSHIRIQNTANTRPDIYQDLDRRLELQRQKASDQLKSANSSYQIETNVIVHQPMEPENIVQTERPARYQKTAAKSKITACLQNKKDILQVDGILSESEFSSESSKQTSPESKPIQRRHSSTVFDLLHCNEDETADDSSLDWDYSDAQEHPDPDPSDIFHQPSTDNSFMHPPLNLSAHSENLDTNRVYTFNSILDRLSSSFQEVTSVQNNVPAPEKKGDANQ